MDIFAFDVFIYRFFVNLKTRTQVKKAINLIKTDGNAIIPTNEMKILSI